MANTAPAPASPVPQTFNWQRRHEDRLLRGRLHRSLDEARHAAAAARGMGNAQRWFKWVPRLVRQYRVVHGVARPRAPADAQPEQDFACAPGQRCAGAARPDGIKSAHVVGNSAGGYVSQQLAIHHPERVQTLALYGSTPGLKHSHAATWIPLVKERGLRKFLADTIHASASTERPIRGCEVVPRPGGRQRPGVHRALRTAHDDA